MNGTIYDGDTNILLQVFEEQFKKLNPGHEGEYLQVFKDIKKELNDDDLGRGFYNRLKSVSPVKLIDFENIKNNVFHFTAEFTCKNGQDEFRPDITLFVNGLPLCFVEVKKPNNHGGMVAESSRMNRERFPNKKFRRFINITQLMIFSNNMEYDALGGIVPIQGAFYCTGARSSAPFNCFREDNISQQKIAPFHRDYVYKDINPAEEKKILSDLVKKGFSEEDVKNTLIDSDSMLGQPKPYQTVVAVGNAVNNVKIGELVAIDFSRYAKKKYKEGSLKDGVIQENPIESFAFNTIELDGVEHLYLQSNDIMFVIEDYEEIEEIAIVAPKSELIS